MSTELINLSFNIALFRKDKDCNQQQLAEAMGVGRTTISNWEKGVAYPTMADLVKLSKILGRSFDDLFREPPKETAITMHVTGADGVLRSKNEKGELLKATKVPSSLTDVDPDTGLTYEQMYHVTMTQIARFVMQEQEKKKKA